MTEPNPLWLALSAASPKPSTGVALTGTGSAAFIIGYMVDPEKGMVFLKWLSAMVGPVGFVAFVTLGVALGISVWYNHALWGRLKEKDEEWNARMEMAEQRWSARFQELREDTQKAFQQSADATSQLLNMLATKNGQDALNMNRHETTS